MQEETKLMIFVFLSPSQVLEHMYWFEESKLAVCKSCKWCSFPFSADDSLKARLEHMTEAHSSSNGVANGYGVSVSRYNHPSVFQRRQLTLLPPS